VHIVQLQRECETYIANKSVLSHHKPINHVLPIGNSLLIILSYSYSERSQNAGLSEISSFGNRTNSAIFVNASIRRQGVSTL